MRPDPLAEAKDHVRRLLDEATFPPSDDLAEVADAILPRRAALLALAERYPTPLYAFDPPGFRAALAAFRRAFDPCLPNHAPFYAVKSNHHPWVIAAAADAGFGLDVSSGSELEAALATAAPILFSGPAKSEDELLTAAAHADRVTVQLDSERELRLLGQVSARTGRRVRAGLRVWTGEHGAWSKFGVPLRELTRLWRSAPPGVELVGVQSHLSWNRSPEPYVAVIEEIGAALAQWTADERARLEFLDVGGGYRPHRLEGYFPPEHALGAALQAASEHYEVPIRWPEPFYVKPSVPLDAYAQAIGAALARHAPHVPAVYTEPGRIVSTYAMHLLVRVVDKKSDDLVIIDGGTHMVGWEKYLQIYAPVVNLTRPARTELSVRLGGSLCDSEDVFGQRCFASAIEEGDVLVVPFQGAYSWGTAQRFIRAIPEVRRMED
jgi:diaminopimelate decarboxylase